MMSRTRRNAILSWAYRSRIQANEALEAVARGTASSNSLAEAARELDGTAAQFSHAASGAQYRQIAILVNAMSLLVKWVAAVRAAELEADRFLRSAKILARDVAREAAVADGIARLREISSRIAALSDIDGVPELARSLLSVPLPLPVFTEVPIPRRAGGRASAKPKKAEVVVAFAAFQVNGKPFGDPQTIQPEVIHDLDVHVTVSDWPEKAEELVLESASVEPAGTYDLPRFRFERPTGKAPYGFTNTGRLVVRYPTALYARPLEFAYRASFLPEADHRVLVRGQRHLRIQSFDPERNPESGHVLVDKRILDLRNEVRGFGVASDADLNNFFLLLSVLGGIASQALQDHLFPRKYSEAEFQTELKKLMRQNPRIGSELEVHPQAAGGITDLSFRGIRIELKAENEELVSEKTAMQFIEQTAQYVAGSDRPFGILAIFDGSPKSAAPGLVANDIFVKPVMPSGGQGTPIRIGVVIVRGNLAKPSDLSRRSTPVE
jgi:hypothetical protein